MQQATASSDGLTVSLGASLARPRARLRQLLRGYAVAAPFLLAAFAADDVRLLGEPLQLCIQSDLPPGIMVRADAARLRQVLLNLVDNAVTFNRRDGRLHLALALGENDVRLTVGNTGPGLSAEHRARIFERFFRGDAARSREVAGFGLGLSISREIILAHGGHLDLARCEPDWTEFRAVLPRLA